MKKLISIGLLFVLPLMAFAGGYQVGDKATDFTLKNIDGEMVSLSDYNDAKGFVVVFTCNHCPYAIAYQERLIAIDKKYKDKGYPVIAINPNDDSIVEDDNWAGMKKRAKEMNYTFPYLKDDTQEIAKAYGAERTPHVYVLDKEDNDLIVKYIGTIDDNYKDASQVEKTYLEDALDALLAGKKPEPDHTKAIGCTIKWAKK
ncbi:MAG: thioredoxin family protein [Bacteroidota bacterium]